VTPPVPPDKSPDNDAIAAAFADVSQLLELTGDNPHRVRSYASIARTIEGLPRSAAAMLADGTLLDVKGIGEGTAARVKEIVETGRLGILEELRAMVPEGLGQVLQIEGLGPKRVREIWQTLGVTSVVELEYACLENRLRDLKGFGDKTQQNVLNGIGFLKRSQGRRLLSQARAAAERCLTRLQREPAALRLGVVGPVRRMQPTVAGVQLLASAHDDAALLEAFAHMAFVEEVRAHTPTEASVLLEDGTPVTLTVVPDTAWFAALFVRTGSEAHVAAITERCKERGFRLDATGLHEGRHLVRMEEEDDVYRAAGLALVPPELRESDDATPPPDDLLVISDVRGVLHAHSTWSDGAYSIRDMAARAGTQGHSWFAICDHSAAASYAHGLDAARLREQWTEVDALNASGEVGIPIFKGIETDILPDGSLDLPEEILAGLDVVVASVHSAMKQSPAVMTERLVRAVSHPLIHVLGHPTGRLLLGREGYEFDMERVLDACAKHGTAIELNANPHRLDLDEKWLPMAVARGIPIAIDPDAHDLRGIEDVVFGVGSARRVRIRRKDVLTALDVDAFLAWCANKRGRPAPAPWPRRAARTEKPDEPESEESA
jgi:DNA polymerase (family X)